MLRLGWGLLLCAATAVYSPEDPAEPVELTRIPGTRVSLEIPDGFSLATTFTGLMNAETGTSVMVNVLEAPIGEILKSFIDVELAHSSGLEVSMIAERPFGDHRGTWVEATQLAAGQEYSKRVWVFGHGESTIQVVGTCASLRAAQDLPILLRVLGSTRWEPTLTLDPFEGLSFDLTDLAGMQYASRLSSMLMFTPDGELGKGKPIFLGGPSMAPTPGAPQAYAKRRFRSVKSYRRVRPGDLEPLEIDGLHGFECVATAEDRELETPTFIYNVMLFEGDAYWIFQGLAAESEREQFLPRFQRMARGFRRHTTQLRTLDGRCEVTVPRTWSDETVPGDDDDLFAVHNTGSCFVQILSEPRSDFADGFTLTDYCELASEGLAEERTWISPRTPVQLGVRAGLRHETHGEFGEISLTHITYWLEDPGYFHQVVGWYLTEAEEWSRPEVERVLASFRVLEPGPRESGER